MNQSELVLKTRYDITQKLAQAVSEADIFAVIAGYFEPQQPRVVALLFLDTQPQPKTILLVARQQYNEFEVPSPSLNSSWGLADYGLSANLQTDSTNVLLIEDTANDLHILKYPKFIELVHEYRIGSLAIIPLYCARRWHGIILLIWSKPRKFSETDKEIYQSVGKPASVAAASRRNFLIAERLRQRTETIAQIYGQISQTKGFYQLYERLSELVNKFGSEVNLLIRSNQNGDLRILENTASGTEQSLNHGNLIVGPTLADTVRKGWWVENIENSPSPLSDYLNGKGVYAYVCLPFYIADHQWLGSFVAGWRTPHHFDVDLTTILESILPTASTMLANHGLLEQLQKHVQFSDEYLNLIFQYAPVAIHILDIGGNVTFSNNKVLPNLGSSAHEVIGRTWMEVFPEKRDELGLMVQRAVQGDEFSTILALRGQHIWLQYAPLYDVDSALIGSVGIAQDVTHYLEVQEQLGILSQQLIEVEEKERHNLARELHDEIGQSLTAILYQLNKLERLSPGLNKDTLGQIQSIVKALIVQIRGLSNGLHPPILDRYGLWEALRWQCSNFTSQTQIRVDFKFTGSHDRLQPQIELTCYRIVQEALTNIARYAKTDSAVVKVSVTERRVKIIVEDIGIGFDRETVLASHSTFGLAAMRERLLPLKGKLVQLPEN
jgi:PAS domain S-box-containing protein